MSLTKLYNGARLAFSSALLFTEATYAFPHWVHELITPSTFVETYRISVIFPTHQRLGPVQLGATKSRNEEMRNEKQKLRNEKWK